MGCPKVMVRLRFRITRKSAVCFQRWLVPISNAACGPHRLPVEESCVVRPENRPCFPIFRSVEEKRGIAQRTIIRIQKQHLLKSRVHDGETLQLPPRQSPYGMSRRTSVPSTQIAPNSANSSRIVFGISASPKCQISTGNWHPKWRRIRTSTHAEGKYRSPPPQITIPLPTNRPCGKGNSIPATASKNPRCRTSSGSSALMCGNSTAAPGGRGIMPRKALDPPIIKSRGFFCFPIPI